jgi:hypothetical protein
MKAKKETNDAPKYFTKEGYEPDPESLDLVHVVTGRITLDPGNDYERTVAKTTHILDVRMWEMCREEWPKLGMKFIEMLHYPAGTPEGFA